MPHWGRPRHQVQRSRLSTLIAAVNMGISTMRRRPVRTTLTAATVVMLTFTILCFASLTSEVGVRRVFERAPGDDAAGVFLRRLDYKAVNTDVLALLHGREGPGGLVVGHWWLARMLEGDTPFGVAEVATGRSLWLDGVMGVQPEELNRWPRLAEVIEGEGHDTAQKVQALEHGGDLGRTGRELGRRLPVLLHQLARRRLARNFAEIGQNRVDLFAGELNLRHLLVS